MRLFKRSESYLAWDEYVHRVEARDQVIFAHTTAKQSLRNLDKKQRRMAK